MFHRLRIADLRRETEDCISLAFAVPEQLRPAFAFIPGQYLTLRARIDGVDIRRPYSICAGLDDGELRVAIKHVPDGIFSHFVHTALRAGDSIDVMPPAGRFGSPPLPGATRLLIALAAGSGITPILSILRSTLSREPRSRFILLYGSRSTAGIIFRETLEDLKDRHLDRLSVVHILSREAQDLAALTGRLDGAKLRSLLPGLVAPAAVDQAFICGPDAMMADLQHTLLALGVAEPRIQTERFTPAPQAGPRARAPVAPAAVSACIATIIHDGKINQVPIADGEAVLDAALRAGLDLPWSCRGGMCCTCRAKVTEGAVVMTQNFSLEAWEITAGFALTCQSHPTTPTVTVDYDQV